MFTFLFRGLKPFFICALLVALATTAIGQSLVGKRFFYQGSDWVKHHELHFISNTTVEGSKNGRVITMSYKRDGDFVFIDLYGNQAEVYKQVGEQLRGAIIDKCYGPTKPSLRRAPEETVETLASSNIDANSVPEDLETGETVVQNPFQNPGGIDDPSGSSGTDSGVANSNGTGNGGGDGRVPTGGPSRFGNSKYNLPGRKLLNTPSVHFDGQDQGMVVVDIYVGRHGRVVRARLNYKLSNTTNRQLCERAKKAALEARFSASSTAGVEQRGTMSFLFMRD